MNIVRRAVIVGGGIGGMTAALALRKSGFDAVILERRRKLDDLHAGGGMVLWHNAMRALGELGIAGEVADAGSGLEHMDWTTFRGGQVASWPLRELNAELGLKAIGIARSDLHGVLTRAVGGEALKMGADVIRSEPDGDGVTAVLEGGDQVRGDVLIGADGINSATRIAQIGDGLLRPAGYELSFGMVDAGRGSGDAFKEYVGRGARFIVFPVGRGLTYWSAIYVARRHHVAGHGADPATLLDIYRGWPDPIESLIASTEPSSIYRRDIADRRPVRRWGAGRVTLLGDAAHPMTPNLGQGACQAIEDAVVLAKHLAASPDDYIAALRSYEQRRFARTAAFVNRSRWIGAMGRWKQPMACLLRDQIQKVVFPLAYLGHRADMAYEP